MNAKKRDSCRYYLEAIENKTDCKQTDCNRHLLYKGLKLDVTLIKKTDKYYRCYGCDAYSGIEWEFPEIAELWGRSKQIVFHWEKQAIEKLRRELY